MIDVAFLTRHSSDPWFRQTPGGAGRWGDVCFGLNQLTARHELLVVYDDLATPIETTLPADRRVLVIPEPLDMRPYPADYLAQFGVVVAPMLLPGYAGRLIRSPVGLPWHFGIDKASRTVPAPARYDFEALTALPRGDKRPVLSAVISTKMGNARHRNRVALVRALSERLGDRFQLFGKGFREVDDKADAILPYAYHLAIENNADDNFFTEKLTDAFLGWALPIYSGCPNVTAFFPSDALVQFDLDAADALDRIVAALDQPIDAARLAAIAEARRRTLEVENTFARLAGHAVTLVESGKTTRRGRYDLFPIRAFSTAKRRLRTRALRVWRGLTRRTAT